MGYLQSCSRIGTTVSFNNQVFNKMLEEKVRCDLHKNDTCLFEQIFEATPHEIAALPAISQTIQVRRTRHAGLG